MNGMTGRRGSWDTVLGGVIPPMISPLTPSGDADAVVVGSPY